MIMLNAIDRGADDATLDYIIKNSTPEMIDEILKSNGFEVQVLDDGFAESEYEPISKSEMFDLIKARKVKMGAVKNAKGKPVQKVMKRILCRNSKTGKEYFQMRMVNADVASDATLAANPLKSFDEHVSLVRRQTTAHLTEYAADINDMVSTPEGLAAYNAINKAIGKATRNGKLTKSLNYTDIRYCTDTTPIKDEDGNIINGCLAIAKNTKTGKDQYFYSQEYQEQADRTRLQRAMVLASPVVRASVDDALENGAFENEDLRDCFKLMYHYGMKTGNEEGEKKNQLGTYVTQGATSLTAGNVYIEKKRVKNAETGKTETVEKVYVQYYQQAEKGDKAHQQSIEIKDPKLAQRLREKKESAADDNERIFTCTKNEALAACKQLFECNCEDLRSAFGFMKWEEARHALLGDNPFQPKRTERLNKETGKKEKLTPKRIEMEIAEYIMEQMGVTDKRSVEKYINKNLIKLYETKPKEKAQKDKEAKKAAAAAKKASKKPKAKTTKPKSTKPKKAKPAGSKPKLESPKKSTPDKPTSPPEK